MGIESRNNTVKVVMGEATYGFQFESLGDVRLFEGEWHLNGVPFNEIIGAMLKNFNGTAAVQIFVAPIATDYRVADNTLVQGDFSYRPVPATPQKS